jgi:competence protein ComEC
MHGKYFYFALASFVGVLCALGNFLPFFLLTVIYHYLLYKYKRFTNLQLVLTACLFFLFLLVGQHAEATSKTVIPNTSTTFYLEYTQDPKIDGDLLQVQATETRYKEKLLIRYVIKSQQEKEALMKKSFYGCLCRVSGTIKKPAIAKNPNGFNYLNFLETKKIYWLVESEKNPLQICSPVKWSPFGLLKQLRFTGINYLEEHFPAEIASLSAALIFGDRSMLGSEVLADYQKTGIVHLLAISGLHVSLLIGMVFYLGIRIGLTRQFMINFLLIILPVYVILTGGSPSVIRSALMIFLVLLTVRGKSKRKLLPIDAVSLAFMLYLVIDPIILFDVGFQLSFLVSFVIIVSAPHILQGYKENGVKMLVTSAVAQLAALPLLLYHYFEMSMLGIFANLLYIPLFSFVYLPGLYLLYIIQILFGTTPQILIKLILKIIILFNHLIGFLANFSFATFVPGRPNPILLIVYLLILIAIFYIWESRSYPKRKARLFMFIVVLFAFQPGWNWLNPYGEVTMIDVGQGDSILIHLPHGKGNYLIDTGGTIHFPEEKWRERAKPYEVGRDVVVPFLKAKGITKIDKLILTHGDMDHIGGTFSILQELEVKQILIPAVVEPSETELSIIEEAKKKRIPVIKVSSGEHWENNGSKYYILSPEKNFAGERNSGSITIFAQLGGVNWFFGGDLDQAGEEEIIKKYPHLTVDVLKAGHHGSKTSSDEAFIKQLKPNVALISAGEKNRYGHPHQEVLDRLTNINSIIYRTDQHGAITYRFFDGKGTFFTYLP